MINYPENNKLWSKSNVKNIQLARHAGFSMLAAEANWADSCGSEKFHGGGGYLHDKNADVGQNNCDTFFFFHSCSHND